MRRVLMVIGLLVLAVPTVSPESSWAAPLCFGKPATHVMSPGDEMYIGEAGVQDVIVGTRGADQILSYYDGDLTDQDLVCGLDGDDTILVGGVGSKADGGPGRDHMNALDGAEVAGSTGNDELRAYAASFADGGSGDDVMIGIATGTVHGGSGNDTVTATVATVIADCGSGSDKFRANQGEPAKPRNCEHTF